MAISKDLKKKAAWVEEAHKASKDWRAESWRDCEMFDGEQISGEDFEKMKAAGIDPITINRTFPVVNLLLGGQSLNKNNIIAKARTGKDSEISQTMTEGIQFVMDQNEGEFAVSQSFKDQVVPGLGWGYVGRNPDPRREKITYQYRDWKEMFSDPFADLWSETKRYMFYQKWVDLDTLKAAFPGKGAELGNMYDDLSENTSHTPYDNDEADIVENMRQCASGVPWVDNDRRRVRPVEMWYPKFEKCQFAVFADGRVIEITNSMDWREQYQLITSAQEVVDAVVPKMYYSIFVSSIELEPETPSPMGHDMFPFVPFVGYTDRFGFPYGVPRQIRGQDEEVNKRRSMALAMLKSRRVTLEDDLGTPEELQDIYEEANKLDGFVVVPSGKIEKIKIEENAALAPSQMSLMQQSESEIQEVSGANAEAMGYRTNTVSGVAKERQQQQAATVTAPLFGNLRRSMKRIGERAVAGIQKEWTGEKILRITDRLSGADKFIELNKQVMGEGGQVIEVKNDMTQGRYDLVVSQAPQTDTVKEKTISLVQECISKATPEAIPLLMSAMFEMIDLPNKEQFMAKLKPLLGENPAEEGMTPDERKEAIIQQLEAEKQVKAEQDDIAKQGVKLELRNKELENEKLEVEIRKIMAEATGKTVKADGDAVDTEIKKEKHATESLEKGMDIGERIFNDGETSPEKGVQQ